jgi:Protein of unknown function (DUF669)
MDSSFWDALRVKALLDKYLEGFIEYAIMLQDEYSLTDKYMERVTAMALNNVSNLSKMWKKAVPIQPSFSNVPDGDYVGDLKEMKLGQAKKGRFQVEWTLEVVDGDMTGKTVKRFDGISDDNGQPNETGMGYLKNVFEIIGFDAPDEVESWQEAFDAFVADPNRVDLYDFTVKTNNNFANVYINGVSEYSKGVEGEEQVATEEEAATEEEVGEEVGEEMEVVEEQQVVAPTKRVVAKPVAAKPVAQPAKRVAVAVPAKKAVVQAAQPVRRIVSLRK